MVRERQTSFASGELSATLHGRTDLREYTAGAAKIRNFIVTPHGSLTTRTGTQYVALMSGAARLFAFVYSETDNYVLVFTDETMTVYGTSSTDARHGFVVSGGCSTPYSDSDLSTLQFAQLGNRVTIVSPNHNPMDLVRSGSTWTLDEILLDAPSRVAQSVHGSSTISGIEPLLARNKDLAIGGDSSHLPREWSWAVSYVVRFESGRVFETQAKLVERYYTPSADLNVTPMDTYMAGSAFSSTALPALVHVSSEYPVRIWSPWFPKNSPHGGNGSALLSAYEEDAFLVETRVYRGRRGTETYGYIDAGRFGYIGSTTGEFFEDLGAEPDYSIPPRGAVGNPFYIYSTSPGSVSVVGTEKPRAVCYHEGRRYFGGTEEHPNRVRGSRVNRFDDHELVAANAPDDAPVEFDLATSRAQGIRHLVAAEKLLAFTTSDEWMISGSGQDDPISAADVPWARSLGTERGSSTVAPVKVGGTIVFLEKKGNKPRGLVFTQGGRAQAIDLSYLSRHLFEGYTVLGWAYAEDPFQALYVARSDGALLVFSYVPEYGVMGWTRCDLAGGGLVEDVCTKPEGSEDAVYLIVNRDGSRYLERMSYKILPTLDVDAVGESATPDMRYAIQLDLSRSYNGKNSISTRTLTPSEYSGGGWDLGATIQIDFGATYTGRTDDTVEIDNPDGAGRVRVLLTDEVTTTQYLAQIIECPPSGADDVEPYIPESMRDEATLDWYLCADTVIVGTHLNGESVTALVDGYVLRGLTVSSGTVALGVQAAIAHVGLEFTPEFESLNAAQERGKEKIIQEILIELEHTRGGEVGESLDDQMSAILDRDASDAYAVAAPKRTEVRVSVRSSWNLRGRAAVRQNEPLPMTILGLTRVMKHGG